MSRDGGTKKFSPVLAFCFHMYSGLIGVDTRSTSLFSRGREPLINRSAIFALGERINVLKEIDECALIPHIGEASSKTYPYEVFRSCSLICPTALHLRHRDHKVWSSNLG